MNHIEMDKNKLTYGKIETMLKKPYLKCPVCEQEKTQKYLNELCIRIDEIALKCCSEYPNIDECNPFEQLLAIETTLKGILLANEDNINFMKYIMKKYNIPEEEIEYFYKNVLK